MEIILRAELLLIVDKVTGAAASLTFLLLVDFGSQEFKVLLQLEILNNFIQIVAIALNLVNQLLHARGHLDHPVVLQLDEPSDLLSDGNFLLYLSKMLSMLTHISCKALVDFGPTVELTESCACIFFRDWIE